MHVGMVACGDGLASFRRSSSQTPQAEVLSEIPKRTGVRGKTTILHVLPRRTAPAKQLRHDGGKEPGCGNAAPALDADFSTALPAALAAVESQDADGDGTSNLDEIQGGTPTRRSQQQTRHQQLPRWRKSTVQRVPLRPAPRLQKVLRDFCGVSPRSQT